MIKLHEIDQRDYLEVEVSRSEEHRAAGSSISITRQSSEEGIVAKKKNKLKQRTNVKRKSVQMSADNSYTEHKKISLSDTLFSPVESLSLNNLSFSNKKQKCKSTDSKFVKQIEDINLPNIDNSLKKEYQTNSCKKHNKKNIEDKNVMEKSRKSVRFQSPKKQENGVLDEAIDLNNTFEVMLPKITKDKLLLDASLNQGLLSASPIKYPTSVQLCEMDVNKCQRKSNLLEDDNLKLCLKSMDSDIKNCINSHTRHPQKSIDSFLNVDYTESNKTFETPEEMHRQITFSIGDEVTDKLHQEKSMLTNASYSKNLPKMERTSTFTKIDSSFNISSFNISQKTIDSSKVNKRRRWDKSRCSAVFDLVNTSTPWENSSVNKTLDSSNRKSPNKPENYESKVNKSDVHNSNFNFGAPPSGTSTPFSQGKVDLYRATLSKNKQKVSKVNKSTDEVSHKFVRTKVPNFALIHQRAYDKLENLKEMSERKAARAKLLLSGHKPPSGNISKTSARRRELIFNPSQGQSSSFTRNSVGKSLNKSDISVTKFKTMSPSKSNPRVENKENKPAVKEKINLLKIKSQIPKFVKPQNVKIAETKAFTRFGFKIQTNSDATARSTEIKAITKTKPLKDTVQDSRNVERIEIKSDYKTARSAEIKAIVTKSKPLKDTVQERRNLIKGVRSNRRFELLMSMRNK